MQARGTKTEKHTRDHWIVAAIIGLPWLYWVAKCCAVYLQLPLPRDPMIFQYTAWAVRQGEVLYRDILDVNGPLITWMHLAFHALGGETARGLRWLDLATRVGVFAVVGAALPCAVALREPRASVRLSQRVAWAFATAITLLSAYFSFNFWDTAQRDGLYFLWILLSVAAQTEAMTRGKRGLLCGAGLLSGLTWLGKPTFALFSVAQTLPLLVDAAQRQTRVRVAMWFAPSALLGALGLALVSTSIADMPRWLRLLTHDVALVYRHIHAVTSSALWTGPRGGVALVSIVQAGVLALCVRRRLLPARSLVIGFLPLPAIANIAIQSKGYFYHYEPLWMGLALQWLVMIAAAWSHLREASVRSRGAWAGTIAFTGFVSGMVGLNVTASSHFRLDTLITPGHPAASDERLRLQLFSQRDSMLLDERIAAEYLTRVTTPDQRVQVFGMDPGVLFLAKRRSATPYIYSFDLVLDEAREGARLRGIDRAGMDAITDLGEQRRADFLQRLRERPPAKIVFPERADFLPDTPEHAFRAHLPAAAAWLDAHYQLEARPGTLHIYGLSASTGAR